MHRYVLLLLLPLLAAALPLWAVDYPPQNHRGADLIVSHGDRIWGVHSGVGRFEVPTTATLAVHLYYPDVPGSGTLDLHAREIVIAGTLDAEGAGYTGGGGGFGGGLAGTEPGYEGKSGVTGSSRYTGYPGHDIPEGLSRGRAGDGPFAGVWIPKAGQSIHGGYAGVNANDDATTDTSVRMGSGGGGQGGGGGFGGCDGGGPVAASGGTGGGPGGGAVRLFAMERLSVTGLIMTSGGGGGSGWPGQRGHVIRVSPCAYYGADGGDGGNSLKSGSGWHSDGAGGGVLMLCERKDGLLLTGLVEARSSQRILGGSARGRHNGGTIKVFYRGDEPTSGTLRGGRYYFRDLDELPLEREGWVVMGTAGGEETSPTTRSGASAWKVE